MAEVLIATLGDSPIVVTSMYYLLTEQEKLPIERVIVLHSEGENRRSGYTIIEDALSTEPCSVDCYLLPFEDAYNKEICFTFLSQLVIILHACQQRGDMVHLSLAGGRKNMAAIMSIVAPLFYRSIKGLYHVIDKGEFTRDRENFKSIQELENLYIDDKNRLLQVMHPDLDNLKLVRIPLKNVHPAPESYVQGILNMTIEQMLEREDDPDEEFYIGAIRNEARLPVYFTKRARKDFENLGGGSRERNFRRCFKGMRYASHLVKECHLTLRDDFYPMHFYKGGGDAERPLFHTEPGDIINYPNSIVEKVVIERLAIHRDAKKYEPEIKQLERTVYSEGEDLYGIDEIFKDMLTKAQAAQQRDPSILIVPMGTVPMVATQLYTLLSSREKRAIREVILLYPDRAESVRNAAERAKDAFNDEKAKKKIEDFTCTLKPIPGLADITSAEDCETYQRELEQTIIGAQRQYPDCRIDLALSGGRKGMAAMALFAAQRTQLREVYHTLITDPDLDRQIEFATEEREFKRLPPKEKNDLLFLRTYQAREADFRLFKVPMGPLRGK